MLKTTKVVRKGILGMDPDSLPSERKRLTEPDRPPRKSQLKRATGKATAPRTGKAGSLVKEPGEEATDTDPDTPASRDGSLTQGGRRRPKPLRAIVRTPRLDRHPRKMITSRKVP